MTTRLVLQVDGAVLAAEAQRYLAAVEEFRAEGREPSWLPEEASRDSVAPRRRKPARSPRLDRD
jgi:hypothetical protein